MPILCSSIIFIPQQGLQQPNYLTHWGRVTDIYVDEHINTGSDNGLLPEQCQAII